MRCSVWTLVCGRRCLSISCCFIRCWFSRLLCTFSRWVGSFWFLFVLFRSLIFCCKRSIIVIIGSSRVAFLRSRSRFSLRVSVLQSARGARLSRMRRRRRVQSRICSRSIWSVAVVVIFWLSCIWRGICLFCCLVWRLFFICVFITLFRSRTSLFARWARFRTGLRAAGVQSCALVVSCRQCSCSVSWRASISCCFAL